MVINDDDKICVVGLHRSGTSTISLNLSSETRKFCGEITSAQDFAENSFAEDGTTHTIFKPWQKSSSAKHHNIQKFDSIHYRLDYVDRCPDPVLYKVLINDLPNMTDDEIIHVKHTMLLHKVVFCVRPFKDIIISLLVRPSVRQWLINHGHHDVTSHGVQKNKFAQLIKIHVPYNKQHIQKIVEQKPSHLHAFEQFEKFVVNIPNHVIIRYQEDLENHAWLKPYYDQSKHQHVKNPFIYSFDYDVDAIVDQIKNKCEYWY